ncbi:MAG: hemolysin family protein [Bacteroidota bacterium]
MSEIFIILGLLVLNGLFAMCEIALVSSRKSKLEQHAAQGSKGAKTALELLKEPEKFLSTVQIGITLVGIVAGAYGAEAFTQDIQPFFERFEWIKQYAEQISFTSIVVVITYFSLVIGELVPKSIALNNPEGITITFAPFMRGLAVVTYPIVVFLSISTKLFLKLIMLKERNEPPVSEEELKYMINTSTQHGVIEKQESEIMQSVFRFGDHKASSIMVHKKDIVWLDIQQNKEKILSTIFKSTHAKYPVCEGTLDKILGVVPVRDLLRVIEKSDSFDLKPFLIEPLFIPLGTPALKILDMFRKKRIHIGFVVNEYGGTEGLITLHDLFENIVGEFPEIGEVDEIQIIKREDGSFLMDGELKIDELRRALNMFSLPNEANYLTLAGLAIYQLHKIPKAGDSFVLNNFKFEIIDMDGNRVDKILISPIKSASK